jgi:hypothetical protein
VAYYLKNIIGKILKTMRMTILNILIAASIAIGSCGKDGGGGSSGTAPSNLQLNAVVATDNSGNVNFTATATNATSYDYDFGNGVYQNVVSGVVTYRYPTSGNYNVKVTAKNSSNLTVNKTISIVVNVAQSLVWSDEFNTPGAPDPGKWTYDIGTVRVDGVIMNCNIIRIVLRM